MCDLAQVYACNESMLSQHTEGNDLDAHTNFCPMASF